MHRCLQGLRALERTPKPKHSSSSRDLRDSAVSRCPQVTPENRAALLRRLGLTEAELVPLDTLKPSQVFQPQPLLTVPAGGLEERTKTCAGLEPGLLPMRCPDPDKSLQRDTYVSRTSGHFSSV